MSAITDRDAFIEENFKLTHWFAQQTKKKWPFVDYDEIHSCACLALVKAVDNFKPRDEGQPFSSFYVVVARNEFLMYQRKPRRRNGRVLSLETPTIPGLTIGDTLQSTFDLEAAVIGNLAADALLHILKSLNSLERNVVALRAEGCTTVEIAKRLGISQSYSSRILTRVHDRLLNVMQ